MPPKARTPQKKKPAPVAKRSAPPTRDKLNTAIARAEVRETRPPNYDPLETTAPLRPYTYMSESQFKYDDFISQRRYARRGLHGENDNRFDPNQHEATTQYRQRLEAQPLGVYTESDPLIDAEREANLIEQPPEAQEQLRTDLRNQRFISAIKGPVTRPEQIPADLRRAREVAAQTRRTAHQIETQLAQQAAAQNPDFFTSLDGYSRTESKKHNTSATSANDAALIKAIEAELNELAEADDVDDNDDEREQRRVALEKERNEILQLRDKERAINDDDDDDDNSRRDESNEGGERSAVIPVIATHEARQLLECNPLVSLHTNLRTQFLQLPEAAKVWQLLYPIVSQHESHRQHFNVVELVRAMNLCGAKYDGCIKLRARTRLAGLLDGKFFKSFIRHGQLLGGHEHWPEDGSCTTFTVFKFYLVRRDKANTETLVGKAATTADADKGKKKTANSLLDKEATNIDNQIDQGRRHMLLNAAGLYDADERVENNEDDGTDEYGTMHDIKYLDREFMFSVRIVCVEPVDAAQCEPYNGYVSMEDNDFELPRESLAVPTDQAQQSVWSINNERTNRGTSNTSTSRFSSSNAARSASVFEDDDDDNLDPSTVDAEAFVHSDDDDERERAAHDRSMQNKPYAPPSAIVLNAEQAHRLVGKWKAADFLQRVNSHTLGLLCIRSFMFYASTKQ